MEGGVRALRLKNPGAAVRRNYRVTKCLPRPWFSHAQLPVPRHSPALLSSLAGPRYVVSRLSRFFRAQGLNFGASNEQLRSGISMMAESDVSRRNVVEGAAVLGGAVLASPAVAGAKESQGFLNPGTYDKKKDFRAPVVRFLSHLCTYCDAFLPHHTY
jgi:hypothetical protein